MALTVDQIVIAGPKVRVFVAPASTAAPANSIALGTDWGGSWVDVGFTSGGAVLKTATEHAELEMDQVNSPVADMITKQNAEITFAAGEATLTNMKQALGYGTVTAGSTESTFGVSATDGIPTYYAVGFEGYAPGADSGDAWYRRVIIWKALPGGEFELENKKDAPTLVQYTMKARYDASQTSTERLYKVIDRVVD